jgi:apolipoprotein N-acyltransferase
MNTTTPPSGTVTRSGNWLASFLWLGLAVICFYAAYWLRQTPVAGWLMLGYAYGLIRLTDQPTVRRAFYFGLAAGFLCYAPQLLFFFRIFSVAAVVLWLILAAWVGVFTALGCGITQLWGRAKAVWLLPVLWLGCEYFRSELYFLKFSWLNAAYAAGPLAVAPDGWHLGMYGVGLVCFGLAALAQNGRKFTPIRIVTLLLALVVATGWLLPRTARTEATTKTVTLAGVQLEFPSPTILPKMLNLALAKHPDAAIFVLSEYTLDGGVPVSLKNWCREHRRFLVVGGKDHLDQEEYYNTAYVVGTNGEVVFQQAKCVPIQFFKDGRPAKAQQVWESPWGKIGLCICYDLSYTRVTDELVRQGAQLLIVPTMDVEYWGRAQHELHARVAPVRAAEYGVPIFRVASSGISQAVTASGEVIAKTSVLGMGDIFAATLPLPEHGTLPLDRHLALPCILITAVVLILVGCQEAKKSRRNTASSTPH